MNTWLHSITDFSSHLLFSPPCPSLDHFTIFVSPIPSMIEWNPVNRWLLSDRYLSIVGYSQIDAGESLVTLRSIPVNRWLLSDRYLPIVGYSQINTCQSLVTLRSTPVNPQLLSDRYLSIVGYSQKDTGESLITLRSIPVNRWLLSDRHRWTVRYSLNAGVCDNFHRIVVWRILMNMSNLEELCVWVTSSNFGYE